jgi:voltage-gated potassium channel
MPFRKFQKWAHKANILTFIGLSGVHPKEPKKARTWGIIFNYIVVIVAIVLLLQWQLELLNQLKPFPRRIINISVWLFFVLEIIVLLFYVNDRWRFIRQNWLLPIIIVGGVFVIAQYGETVIIMRTIRPILAILILAPALTLFLQFFMDGKLRTTLFAATIFVVIFGLLVSGVDPNINSVWDGIWWAVVTVSTVGYGDVVPSSALGRLISVALIVLGLGIFVTITANFLALVLRREVKEVKEEEKHVKAIMALIKEMSDAQAELNRTLNKINSRLEKLEPKDPD